MKGCNQIRRLIDEAEKPEVFPFEVNQHLRQCADCEAFSDQRTNLRKLLASGVRVTAPVNFDAVLNARLATVRARRSFGWLTPATYLRLGAATAGLVVMLFAAQYAGFFPSQRTTESQSDARIVTPGPVATIPQQIPPPNAETQQAVVTPVSIGVRAPRPRREASIPANPITAEDGGVMLVRGTNGDLDIPMPTVSVGAQPLLYVGAGKHPARSAGASF